MSKAMANESKYSNVGLQLIIQLAIAVLFFVGTSFGRETDHINWDRIFFLGNYFAAAMLINYWLIPKYFHQKKYGFFVLGAIVILVVAILFEELVLEQIIAPDTRGARFSSIFFTMVRMLPFVMLFVGFKFAWDAQNKQREVDTLRAAMSDSQLQFLKSQINPHFLFNSLNNLYSYALERSEKTPEIILELSSLLRYMLYETQGERVELNKEVSFLQDFVKLQGLQIEDRGSVNFDVSGDFVNKRIAPLILIVFVENCFKHSTSSLSDDIAINLTLSVTDNQLTFKAENSFDHQENVDDLNSGIGLENVKTRLNLIYPDRHSLDVHSDDNRFTVNLEITLD